MRVVNNQIHWLITLAVIHWYIEHNFSEIKVSWTMNSVNTKVEALSGMFSGMITEVVFYSLDSYKVMKQAGNEKIRPSRLFKGIVPVLLTGSAPTFGIFFAVGSTSL